jgi:hypothetical protein
MDIAQLKAHATCTATLDRAQAPSLLSSNSFTYTPYSTHLPPLDYINERFPFGLNPGNKSFPITFSLSSPADYQWFCSMPFLTVRDFHWAQ